MSTDTILTGLLSFDSLAAAEEITGASYKADQDTVWLGIGLMHEKRKRTDELLLASNDSTFSNNVPRYLEVINAEGFVEVLHVDIQDTKDKLFVFWKEEEGILLKFDTYFDGTSVNGGDFYYNWKPRADYDLKVTATSSWTKEGVLYGSHDCREAIRFHIRRLREEGQFLPTWVVRPFLWLLHYQDTKVPGYDYKAINEERISKLPESVQAAITPKL